MRLAVYVSKPVIGDPEPGELYYEIEAGGSVSADTGLRQSGVSADTDTVILPSERHPLQTPDR